MRILSFISIVMMFWCTPTSAQIHHLQGLELVKPPYRHVFRTVDYIDQLDFVTEGWAELCAPVISECTKELWLSAPQGTTSLAVSDVRACATDMEPICQLSRVCPEGGFLEVGPGNLWISQFAEYLFYCEGDAITLRLTSRFPVGPAPIWGKPSMPYMLIDGQRVQISLYEPTCQEGGMPMVFGCLVPTTSDGTQFEKICVDPQLQPQVSQTACAGDWYIETDDGRCWNLPCHYSLGLEGLFLATEYGCQFTFGEPVEVACNSQCAWTGSECGCEGCQPECEDLEVNCLSEVPKPEFP
jgi:hypothetical protein